jgi:hypothetical protein
MSTARHWRNFGTHPCSDPLAEREIPASASPPTPHAVNTCPAMAPIWWSQFTSAEMCTIALQSSISHFHLCNVALNIEFRGPLRKFFMRIETSYSRAQLQILFRRTLHRASSDLRGSRTSLVSICVTPLPMSPAYQWCSRQA